MWPLLGYWVGQKLCVKNVKIASGYAQWDSSVKERHYHLFRMTDLINGKSYMLTVTNNKETSVCTVFVRCVNTLNLLFRLDKNLEENTFLSSISNSGEMYAQYVLRLFVTSCSVAHQAPI